MESYGELYKNVCEKDQMIERGGYREHGGDQKERVRATKTSKTNTSQLLILKRQLLMLLLLLLLYTSLYIFVLELLAYYEYFNDKKITRGT